jgi:hypothetical protein
MQNIPRDMKKEKTTVVFHHGDFSEENIEHGYFGANGPIHRQLERVSKLNLSWLFIGGFIHHEHYRFWQSIEQADIMFIRSANMDYHDMAMNHHHAEESMLRVLTKVKKINSKIKVFFFEESPDNIEIFSKFGTFITDLHGDEEMLKYFRKL